MRKTVLVLICLTLNIFCYCQEFTGFTGGVVISKIKGDDVREDVSISNKVSFRLAVSTEFGITDNLFVQFGFGFVGRGYKAKMQAMSNNVSMSYFEVPLGLIGKLPLGSEGKIKLLAGGGIYGGLGLYFKTKFVDSNDPFGESESVNSGRFADFNVKIGDFGLNMLSGVEINEKVQITFNYQHGLTNIFYGYELGMVKNRSMGVNFSYSW